MIRLVIKFDPEGLSPREVRATFAQALRDAIGQARTGEHAIAEELWRVVPDPEKA